MKRVLYILLIILFITIAGRIRGQQTYMFTQYYFNPFLINPAVAETNNYYQIRANNRFQWVGLGDGPVTNALSVYGPYADKKYDMGYGGNIVSDITGPISTLALNASYAYNIAINNAIRLSGGINFGMTQYKVDGTQVTLPDAGIVDNALPPIVKSYIKPDASAGLYLYSTNFNIGFAANQLFNSKINKEINNPYDCLTSHFFLTGFYKYYIDRDFQLEPGIIIKAVDPAPVQVDLTCRVIYQNIVSAGIAYRSQDAVSVMIGYTYENKISIAYAYDIGISPIRQYTSGSHEIMLSYRFNAIK